MTTRKWGSETLANTTLLGDQLNSSIDGLTGSGYVVVASKAGADHHPAWYHNLRAHPDAVTIEVGGRRIGVHPRDAEGAEREELWRLVNDNYNGYQVYQQRAGQRIIPVVLLEPA